MIPSKHLSLKSLKYVDVLNISETRAARGRGALFTWHRCADAGSACLHIEQELV